MVHSHDDDYDVLSSGCPIPHHLRHLNISSKNVGTVNEAQAGMTRFQFRNWQVGWGGGSLQGHGSDTYSFLEL